MLHLIRHGRPLVRHDTPAASWELDDPDQVRRDAARWDLPVSARWCSSDEPKARATAAVLTSSEVEVWPDLGEQQRAATWFADPRDFQAAVVRAFHGPEAASVAGWEPLAQTRARVLPLVHRLVAETTGDLVLVGHGTAWTLVVAELTGSPPDLDAWARLAMPDHCALQHVSGARWTLAVPWGG